MEASPVCGSAGSTSLLLSPGNPNTFCDALDHGGAFGFSALFLLLSPLMAGKQRHPDNGTALTVSPMVPFGKISLAGQWKANGTLIVEQGADDKLGVFDFFRDMFELN
jgi:hypothetical protein